LSYTSYWRAQSGTVAIVLIIAIILFGLLFRLARIIHEGLAVAL
jgi:hypothetical protein